MVRGYKAVLHQGPSLRQLEKFLLSRGDISWHHFTWGLGGREGGRETKVALVKPLFGLPPPKSGCTKATFAPVRIDATLGILTKATYQLQVVSMYEGWGMVIPATSWFNKYLPSSMDLTWTKPSSSNPIRPKFAATVSV